jgi:hypothetical protein
MVRKKHNGRNNVTSRCTMGRLRLKCDGTVHAQKPDFVFRRTGRVHLNRQGRQFSRILTAEVCASAVVMLDAPYSEVVWRVLATHSIRQSPLHFPSRASPYAIIFQLDSTNRYLGATLWPWLRGIRCFSSLGEACRYKIQILYRAQVRVTFF